MEQQFIQTADNQLMATALVRALFINKKREKIASPELVKLFFPEGMDSPDMPESVKKWRESEK